MRSTRCLGDLPAVVLATIARTALWTVLLTALWATIAALLGAHVTTVVSDSMAPAVRTGDVVAAVPRDTADLAPGQVLLVDDPDRTGRLRLHRLEEVTDDGLRLRGDANAAADTSLVDTDAVRGVGVLRFPFVGLPGLWIRTGDLLPLVGAASAVMALGLLAVVDRAVRSGVPCGRCGAPRSALVPGTWPTRHRSRASVTVGAVVLVVAVASTTVTGASFTATTDTRADLGSADFPCFRRALDGAVLAWDSDEPRGPEVVDHAGTQDGRMYGQVGRQDRSCSENPFLRFAPSNDSPRVHGTTRGPAPMTFSSEVWFRSDRTQGTVLSFGSDTDAASTYKDRIMYVTRDGRLAFGVQGADHGPRRSVFSTAGVADGAWHHAVATVVPGHVELWLDGRLVATRSDTGTGFSYDGSWRVGRQSVADWPMAGDATFVGDIDTVRVYDRVLTPSDISAHHAAGR